MPAKRPTISSDEESEAEVCEVVEGPDVVVEATPFEQEPTKKPKRKTAASRCLSSFMREEQFRAEMKDKKVQVKCNQTGKIFKAKITALSKENAEPISQSDLAEGSEIFLDMNNRSYPVTVLKVVTDNSKPKNKKKQTDELPDEPPVEPRFNNEKPGTSSPQLNATKPAESVLEDAKQSLQFENGDSGLDVNGERSTPSRNNPHSGSNREVLKMLQKMNSTLDSLMEITKKLATGGGIKKEDDPKYTVNGINLLMLPARDAYAYGRNLLEVLFTKEVLRRSVVVKSIKSKKPALDQELVQLIFDCVRFRYPDYDHTKMMVTLGQKCRDSSRGESSTNELNEQ